MPKPKRSYSENNKRKTPKAQLWGFLLSVFGFFIFGDDQVQDDGNERRGNDTGAAEDQLHCLRRMRKDTGICTHTVTNAERNGYDGKVSAVKRFLGDELNTADNDGGEHHNGSAAENGLRHDGNDRAELGAKTAEDQEDRARGERKAVNDLGHGNEADVLAEGGIGKYAEERREGRTDTVANDTAGELLVGRLSAETAFHNAGNITDGFNGSNDEHDENGKDRAQIKYGLDGHELGDLKPSRVRNLLPVENPCLRVFHAVRRNAGRRKNETHDDSHNIAADDTEKNGGGAGEALGSVLEEKDHCENEEREKKIFKRTEVLGVVTAAEGVDADGDQAQTDGKNDRTRYDSGEEFSQRLDEEAENAFKETADDRSAHDGAVSDNAAAHGFGNALENADKAGGRTHNDRNITADRTDGEELDQRNDTRYEHSVLEQVELEGREFTAGKTARTGDDDKRCQVADEHGENVLKTERDRLFQRHFAIHLKSIG